MWFGLFLMVAMILGLVWWMVWAVKKGKGKNGLKAAEKIRPIYNPQEKEMSCCFRMMGG